MRGINIYLVKKSDFLEYTQTQLGYKILEYAHFIYFGRYFVLEDIEKDKNGKPYFKDRRLHFNISHSKNYVGCCIYNREIGLDIEEKRNINKNVIAKIMAKEDYNIEPIRVWNIKESYSKYLGVGLRLDFKSISINEIYNKYFVFEKQFEEFFLTICTDKITSECNIKFLKKLL